MNHSFKTFCTLAAMAGFLILTNGAQASTFIGDVCFLLDIPEEEESEIIVLGISEIGGGHYTANGYTFDSPQDPPDERTMLRGNIELFGSTIVLSLSGSYSSEGEALALTAHANLSATTLSGTVTLIGTFVETNFGESGIEAQTGNMEPIACPALTGS